MIRALHRKRSKHSRALAELLDTTSTGDAIEKWDKAFEIADGDSNLLVTLASYHYHRGHTAQLVRAVARLQAIAPDAIHHIPTPAERERERWWPRLCRSLSSFIAAWRQEHLTADELFDHARVLEIVGRPEDARRAYRLAQDLDPNLQDYAHRLATIKGGAIAAREDAQTALVRFHDRYCAEVLADSTRRVGGLNGHLAPARLAAFSAVLLPAATDMLFVQAALADRLDRLAKILARLPSSIGLPDGDVASLTWIRKAAGSDPAREAERLYRIVLELKPDHAGATFNLAGILARAGRAAEAVQLFEHVATLSDKLAPHAGLQLAALAEASGDHGKSIDYYTAAAEVGTLGHHHIALARSLRRAGRTKEALAHYTAAMAWSRYVGPEYLMELESLQARATEITWYGNPTLSAVESKTVS